MKFQHAQVMNFKGAFRGLRNPKESWNKSDSIFSDGKVVVGPNDIELAQRMLSADSSMVAAGAPNSKFMRQILVSVDITAPIYWWKEFDTYKVGTVSNSTSTMHKIHSHEITLDCFQTDDYTSDLLVFDREPYNYDETVKDVADFIINALQTLRKRYLETKDKRYWKQLIRWLPESWLQTRTVTLNYAVLRDMYEWRKYHKLTEWHSFCDWIHTLPYAKQLIEYEG